MAGNAVQQAIADALAKSTGTSQTTANSSVRSVQTDSLKVTSKSGF